MPRVSVISGAYNVEGCYSFSASVSSILNQTYTDIEFIICDDGSTDGTWQMLLEFAKSDPRVKLLKNEKNIGLAPTLNRCIEASAGEYIARHDCDDVSREMRLEKQVKYLDSHPEISILGANAYLFDREGVWGEKKFPELVTKKDYLFCSPFQHGAVVMRRDVLEKTGGYRVAKETNRTEDYDLFMTVATFAGGANLQEFLYYFCEDENTLKRRKYRDKINEAKVRRIGFKKLGLFPRAIPYVIKPLIVGLIPQKLLSWLKTKSATRKVTRRQRKK